MKKILIVDDQKGIRLLLDEVFRNEQYETYLASNGIEALTLLKEVAIDCVLLDLRIPGMDGLEIIRRIKEINDEIPIFMMTAFGNKKQLILQMNLVLKIILLNHLILWMSYRK